MPHFTLHCKLLTVLYKPQSRIVVWHKTVRVGFIAGSRAATRSAGWRVGRAAGRGAAGATGWTALVFLGGRQGLGGLGWWTGYWDYRAWQQCNACSTRCTVVCMQGAPADQKLWLLHNSFIRCKRVLLVQHGRPGPACSVQFQGKRRRRLRSGWNVIMFVLWKISKRHSLLFWTTVVKRVGQARRTEVYCDNNNQQSHCPTFQPIKPLLYCAAYCNPTQTMAGLHGGKTYSCSLLIFGWFLCLNLGRRFIQHCNASWLLYEV